MALPKTGSISLSQIASEKGVTWTNASLNSLSVLSINSASSLKPNGSQPHGMSEFRGYNHTASSGTVVFRNVMTSEIIDELFMPVGGEAFVYLDVDVPYYIEFDQTEFFEGNDNYSDSAGEELEHLVGNVFKDSSDGYMMIYNSNTNQFIGELSLQVVYMVPMK